MAKLSKRNWAGQRIWQQLTPYQQAAAMALLEADGGKNRVKDATNVLGAIINRAQAEGKPLGQHVSEPGTYQPLIEGSQLARLPKILQSPEFQQLSDRAEARWSGDEPDWMQGLTHYLTPEQKMVQLYQQNPDKYHNWGPFKNSRGVPGQNWTGYDPETGQYKNVGFRDDSHAFLWPNGKPEGVPDRPPGAMALGGPEAPIEVPGGPVVVDVPETGAGRFAAPEIAGNERAGPGNPATPAPQTQVATTTVPDPAIQPDMSGWGAQYDAANPAKPGASVGLKDVVGLLASLTPKPPSLSVPNAPAPNSKVNVSHLAALNQKRSKFGRA